MPLKILHVITRFVRGGADENTLLSCNFQASDGHQVMLVYGGENHEGIVSLLHPDVATVEIPSLQRAINPYRDIKALFELTRVTRDYAPDIVHTHTSKAGVLGRLAAMRASVPAIIHGVHILPFIGTGPAQARLFRAIERQVAPSTDYFIDVSEGMMHASIENRVGTEGKHRVIPSGMDVARFVDAKPFQPEELARELGLPSPPERLVVCAAALEPRKRHLEFLDAFEKVVAEVPDAHLAITGSGPQADTIRRRAEALGISGNVHLLGFRTDIERWIASADVCTLASEREGLPRTVIQYVMCGKPAVVTDLPGIEAVLEDEVNGFVAASPAEMADPLVSLLTNDDLRDRMAESSRRKDLSQWDARSMVDQIDEVYRDVLEAKKRELESID